MKGVVVALDVLTDGRRIAALLRDGRLEDLLADAPSSRGAAVPGSIFRAVPDRPMKGQGGMMVRLGGGETGFLRDAKGIAPGKPLLVQIATVPDPGKAPPVTRRLTFRSRLGLVTPGRPGCNVSRQISDEGERQRLQGIGNACLAGGSAGLILRSAADGVDEADIREDLVPLIRTAEAVIADTVGDPELLIAAPDAHETAWCDWPDADLFDPDPGSFDRHGIWDMVLDTLDPIVGLLDDAWMAVEPTRALVSVDVNTGGDTSQAAGLKADIAALRALPRVLGMRGLGGQITVDLAPFPRRERSALEQVAAKAIREAPGEMNFAGWTPLGHMEFQRKRDRVPLKEALTDALPDL